MSDSFEIKGKKPMWENPSLEKLNEIIATLNRKRKILYLSKWIIFIATSWFIVLIIANGLKQITLEAPLVLFDAGFASILAIYFEYNRRYGTKLFEDLSNELQWRAKQYGVTLMLDEESGQQPALSGQEIRQTLREFERSTEMVLIPGKYASSIYIGINLSLCLFYIFMRKG